MVLAALWHCVVQLDNPGPACAFRDERASGPGPALHAAIIMAKSGTTDIFTEILISVTHSANDGRARNSTAE
jgi:hypothetical protein